MLRGPGAAEQPAPPATAARGVRCPRRCRASLLPGLPVSFWTALVYLFVLLLSLAAVVGGLVVLKRLEAQRRLREELARLETASGEGGASGPSESDDDSGSRRGSRPPG